jgi:simple sugar transport system substrate-binding protein
MKTFRKVIVLFLTVIILTTIVGCSKKSEKVEIVEVNGYQLKVPDKELKDLEIPIVYMNVTTPFAQFIKMGIDDAAKEFGVNAYMTAPTEWSTENEIKLIEDLIAKGVDGISIAVLDIPALTPIIQKSLEAGIPTTCFNVDAPDSGRLGFVGEDLYKAGQEVGQALVDAMGPKGKVLITTEAQEAYFSQQREAGTRSVLEKYPEIEVLPTLNCPGDQQQMYSIIEAAMKENPDITGVASCGGTCFVLSKYLQDNNIGNANSDRPIYNTGHDLREEKVQQIKDGWSTAQFGQNPYEQGYQAVKMIVDFLKTKDPASFKVIDTGILRVDSSNADEILERIANGEPIG